MTNATFVRVAAMSPSAVADMVRSGLAPAFKRAIRDAMSGHFVKEWPRALPPNQHAVMAYTTRDPDFTLRITIDYEDEAGYQWRRTNISQPKRTDETGGVTPAVDA